MDLNQPVETIHEAGKSQLFVSYATARDAVLRETCRFTIPPVARQETRSLLAPLPAQSRSVLHVLEEPHGTPLYRHPALLYQASVTMFQISLLFLTFALLDPS